MWHSCGKYSLKALFAGCEPHVFQLFKKFAAMVRACGPVRIIPQKTGIAFQVRVRFAGVSPRTSYLRGGFWFARRHHDPRFLKIETYGPRCHVHRFCIQSVEDLDADLKRWIREAYAVGEQKHLEKTNATANSQKR